jgi:four helix bundle protein
MQVATFCYEVTAEFPRHERFGLSMQLRKSAVSIPSNIAEGHNRRSRRSYRNHVGIALGSQGELETQLELARRLRFLVEGQAQRGLRLAEEVGKMLHALCVSLENRPERRLTSRKQHLEAAVE